MTFSYFCKLLQITKALNVLEKDEHEQQTKIRCVYMHCQYRLMYPHQLYAFSSHNMIV